MKDNSNREVATNTIEGIILRNSITFETLITTSNFSVAWANRSPVVIDYLVTNIDPVFNNALYPTNGRITPLSSICLTILQSQDPYLYQGIFRSQVLFECIMNFLNNLHKCSIGSQILYFDILTLFADQSNFQFFTFFDAKAFFQNVAKKLYLDTPARFIQAIVIKLTPSSYSILNDTQLCLILVQEYLNDTANGAIALKLIQNCFINETFVRHSGEVFSNSAILISLRSESFRRRDSHGVDFLRALYVSSIPFRHTTHWGRISDELVKDLTMISDTLINTPSFEMYDNTLGKFFIVLINGTGMIDSKGSDVVAKSIDLFFKYPVNSFVHNFAAAAVQALINNKGDVDDFITRTSLPKRLIQQYLNRNSTVAMYWGQARLISEAIEPYIDKSLYPNWENIISKSNEYARKLAGVSPTETHGLIRSKQGSTLFISLHRIPRRKRTVVVIGIFSFILFLYVAIFI